MICHFPADDTFPHELGKKYIKLIFKTGQGDTISCSMSLTYSPGEKAGVVGIV